MDFPNRRRNKIIGFAHPLHSWDVIALNSMDYLSQTEHGEDLLFISNFCKNHGWDNYIDFFSLLREGKTIVITDKHTNLVWVSSNFSKMTGYFLDEVKGMRPPELLHGEETSEELKTKIRERLQNRKRVKAEIVNYRKNGERYICLLDIRPVINFNGDVVNFLAIEHEKPIG
ncbi:PAS domain-containing protein [Flammeovirgaceae bacterium SG7u.111]|nr:PAS domain-containing protein [Flammeovirgaceae bacterium SG7u.132]WPO38485.1 PAS domain-containing protein [Flammeovirgaceae bacterium SG7u.111]